MDSGVGEGLLEHERGVPAVVIAPDAEGAEAGAEVLSNPLRPRAFGGKGAEGLKKEITSS
jgi:hypothetical protein